MTEQNDGQDKGAILKSRNGTVIAYDQTGLVLRLSDKVIADIGARLGTNPAAARAEPAAAQEVSAAPSVASALTEAELALVEGIDAWDLYRQGEWLSFMANRPGRQGVRRFRRHLSGGGIVADAPGPFYGIFSLGGSRASLAEDGAGDFPHHVLAPADDIGAVGQGGDGKVLETALLAELREQTHDSLVAETLLHWRLDQHATLPLFFTRCETDGASGAAALAEGAAISNLGTSLENFAKAGAALGKRPEILAIFLDFVLEDVVSDAASYRDHMMAVMSRIEKTVVSLGLEKPLFLMRLETNGALAQNAAAVEGQWELAWNHGDHRLRVVAPGYMFGHDTLLRPGSDSRRQMAEMSANALVRGERWRCPVPHLAERVGNHIRVTFQSAADLVIDPKDPLGAGAAAGFHLEGGKNGAAITVVRVDPKDPRALLLSFDKPPKGQSLVLCHACSGTFVSAIRDKWSYRSATGGLLHRWALPARLPVTEGGLSK